MTENEAIKNINALNAVCWDKYFYDKEFARAMAKAVKALHEIQQYRAIGTIEDFKALKEKNEPKKPIELDQWGEYWKCSTCGKYAVDNLGCRYKFCPNCGTNFDWQ